MNQICKFFEKEVKANQHGDKDYLNLTCTISAAIKRAFKSNVATYSLKLIDPDTKIMTSDREGIHISRLWIMHWSSGSVTATPLIAHGSVFYFVFENLGILLYFH